ncbi:MAG: tyrosine-type recombinase/integrase [Phascolarctobacterium sp.]|uniref:site-specific integrase n=1 Tax=Phascolarctobacterium sp. TaxID=2049039 RepID=UPI0026DD94B8|nr:site-specific integrase [Phascolarctobacterium sp.]MDO4920226.1 tyrosine-type recombinase/integrase [Phascolarctobacterium sp.]
MTIEQYETKTKGKLWRYECGYRDWQGIYKRRKQSGFKTKKEAKAAQQYFLDTVSQQPNILFAALVGEYLEYYRARRKKQTVATAESYIKYAILPFFKDMLITDITAAAVSRWQNEIIKKYALTTQRQIQGRLSAILNYAMRFRGLRMNAAREAGSIGKDRAGREQIWKLEEFNRFIECVPMEYKAAFIVLFYSGMRVGELLALTIADYNAAERKLNIDKSLSRVHGQNIIGYTKNDSSRRVITVPDIAAAALDEYISHLYKPRPYERIFELISRDKLQYRLKRGADAANVPPIRIHDLRHSHASLLVHINENIKVIQKRLGHSSIKTTLGTYGHLYEEADAETAARLDGLTEQKKGQKF